MEYLSGGDLETFISQYTKHEKGIKIEKIKLFASQIISAIKYLHDNNIIHQDLKPLNILLASNFERVKLIDLGISK